MYRMEDVSLSFASLKVLDRINIEIDKKGVSCILGPSGCGKTTMLKLFTNLIQPSSGRVRGIEGMQSSFIFQEDRLLPNLTVYENIAFVLKSVLDEKDMHDQILKTLDFVDLNDFIHFYPDELSGGMRQRVNIARAFAFPCDTVFMDEPFKGLDLKVKFSIIDAVKLWVEKTSKSILFVTHDVREAIYLSDTIYLMSERPGSILETIINPLSSHERSLSNSAFYQFEGEIIQKIMR